MPKDSFASNMLGAIRALAGPVFNVAMLVVVVLLAEACDNGGVVTITVIKAVLFSKRVPGILCHAVLDPKGAGVGRLVFDVHCLAVGSCVVLVPAKSAAWVVKGFEACFFNRCHIKCLSWCSLPDLSLTSATTLMQVIFSDKHGHLL